METKVVQQTYCAPLEDRIQERLRIRHLDAEEFIERHASGTLRKNKRLGMCWQDQYLTERVAYEFGWEFTHAPRSRVTVGDAYTEGDCAALTEAGWHIERYQTLSLWPDDVYSAKYLQVEERDGSRHEGVGIIVEQTSAPFVPKGHLVYALVAPYDPQRKAWEHARNPA